MSQTVIKSRNKKNKIEDLTKEVLYNSLAQAIIKLIHTPYIALKVFLFIFVLSALGVCSFLVIQSILNFFSYQVFTSSRIVFETPAYYPKVTICNNNPFTTEHAFDFLKKVNQSVFDEYYNADIYTTAKQTQNLYKLVNRYSLIQMNSKSLTLTEKKKFGHALDDILLSCSFNSHKCLASDFEWTFDRHYGNCFVFNSAQNKQTFQAGLDTGLLLEFYVNFNQNLAKFNAFNGLGAVILLENRDSPTSSHLDLDLR